MTDFLRFALTGLPLGCVYALMASGLVLTHRTAGVFNLAFGAQAFASAALFYELRVDQGWPTPVAFLAAVVVAGVVAGFLLDRALFRHLRSAPVVARLVAGLGLLVAVPAAVELWFGSRPRFNPPSIAPDPDRVYRFGSFSVNGDQVTAVVVTLVVIAALAIFVQRTRWGLRMRAVVESPRLVQLQGVDADRVGSIAWMLSSVMAGLAGVLLAPLFATVSNTNFTVLLVAAIAAAAFGGLSSLWLTLAGGLVLGVAQQVIAGYLPLDSVLAQGLRPSLPFVMLFGILVLRTGLGRRRLEDPLAGVDPPPRGARASGVGGAARALRAAVAVGFVLLAVFAVSDFWLFLLTTGVVFGTVFLSITLVTGLAGQISLAQATFAGIGAFTAGQLASRWDVSILVGVLAGGAVAAAVGALVAVPVRRLAGIDVALATLAFALMVENVVFPLGWAGNGDFGVPVPRPVVAGIDFSGDLAFFFLALGVFGLAALATVRVRRGTSGLFLTALRGSEVGAAASGVSPLRMVVLAFAVSAGIAGVGGAMYGSLIGRVSPGDFSFGLGLFWVVLVVAIGSRSVGGAALAGMSVILLPELLDALGASTTLMPLLFGLGALTFARHPEGVLDACRQAVIDALSRYRPRPRPDGRADVPGASAAAAEGGSKAA